MQKLSCIFEILPTLSSFNFTVPDGERSPPIPILLLFFKFMSLFFVISKVSPRPDFLETMLGSTIFAPHVVCHSFLLIFSGGDR